MSHLAILDVSALAYKFWHGAGRDDALRGVCEYLDHLRAEPIGYVAAAVDHPGPTFRNEIFPAYKANRPAKPAEVSRFIGEVKAAVTAFGLPVLHWPGHEADDVIASATEAAVRAGVSVSILSSDKDLFQLVRPGVSVVSRHRGETTRYDQAAVTAKLGVYPSQVPDLLAIAGDVADNIPGIDGLGERRAAELLQAFGSLSNIIGTPPEAIRAVPRVKKWVLAVQRQADDARTYLRLATLARGGDFPIEGMEARPLDRWALATFLEPVHPALLAAIRARGRR